VDYEAIDGLPTGHERALRTLRSQIDSSKTLLRRYLRELGISPGGDLATVTVPTHLRYRDPFAFDRARKARSTQSTLESQRRRFCQLYAEHKRVKTCLKNDADQESES
jgi:hypothetical protein